VLAFDRGPGPARGTDQDALGAPDVLPPDPEGLLALGVGGVLTLHFADNSVLNEDGVDFRVLEGTFGGAPEPEYASFEVAACEDTPFVPIQPHNIRGQQDMFSFTFDLEDAGLEFITVLRIIDDGDPDMGGNGFDIDAVESLNNCGGNLCLEPPLPPVPPQSSTPCVPGGEPWADSYADFRRGRGTPRGEPEDALGPPDVAPPAFDGMLSLGVGGEITLLFEDNFARDNPGSDMLLIEATYDPASAEVERARFSVAACPEGPFVPIRPIRVTGDELFEIYFDLATAGLDEVRALRIEDDGDTGYGGNGFDIDALMAIDGCEGAPCAGQPYPPPIPTPPRS
jgi:hypothetical protein